MGCSVDRTIHDIGEQKMLLFKQYKELDSASKLKIANSDEPGERLLLCLQFVHKKDQKILANQKVKFYHTNTKGEYMPINPGDESSARLSGTAITDKNGKLFLETILPGDYGSTDDNRHIHSTVFGASPEGYDIHFKQYSSYMSKRFIEGSDQHFLADINRMKDGRLIVFLTISCKFN